MSNETFAFLLSVLFIIWLGIKLFDITYFLIIKKDTNNVINLTLVPVSELTGRALDCAVAIYIHGYVLTEVPPDVNNENAGVTLMPAGYLNRGYTFPPKGEIKIDSMVEKYSEECVNSFAMFYRAVTHQGFKVESEEINGKEVWSAKSPCEFIEWQEGETPLIALCRALVAFSAGEKVTIPSELLKRNV